MPIIGWETCEIEDWVKTEEGKYHSFLWTQTIHPSTFERIVTNRKCGIRRGNSYEVVNISYMCWVFQEKPAEFLVSQIKENNELAKRIAIFDLSGVYTGENICQKVNETESLVFIEFEQFLKDEGYISLLASDAETALDLAQNSNPDIIFLDYRLPGRDGLELLKELNETGSRIPVIFMTAFGAMDVAIKAMQMGAYEYLTKPLDIDKIHILIKRIIEGKESIRNLNIEKELLDNKPSLDNMIGKNNNDQ